MLEKNTKVKQYLQQKQKKNTKENRQLLTYAQNGVRTKPPTMVVKGKRRKLRLQPRESKRLNFIHHLNNCALFSFE